MPEKKPETTPKEKAKHVAMTKGFVDAFQEHFQRKYVHGGPKDGSPLKSFIQRAPDVTPEEFIRVARSTWNGSNKWKRENVVTIAMLCSQWNECATAAGTGPGTGMATEIRTAHW